MILIGLLIIAAVCVVLGVVKASVTWLVASLIASVLAGFLVAFSYARTRRERAARAAREKEEPNASTPARESAAVSAPPQTNARTATGATASGNTSAGSLHAPPAVVAGAAGRGAGGEAGAVATRTRTVIVVDGFPDYHGAGCDDAEGRPTVEIPFEQAVEDGFTPCPHCEGRNNASPAAPPETAPGHEDGDRMVVVVDGLPDYHVEGCVQLAGQETVAIPHGQAREDGFEPCRACAPEAGTQQVWVADGFPDFHREGCAELVGHESLAIPQDQAVEDGFTPCARCAPESDASAQAPVTAPAGVAPDAAEAAAAAGDVWVVDGQPNYHRADCVELIGHASLAVPHDQAVEDGFAECAVCTPEADTPRAAPTEPARTSASEAPGAGRDTSGDARDVYVADGFPDFHLDGCSAAAGLSLQPLPLHEALSFGFVSCSVCDPQHNTALPDAATPGAAGAGESAGSGTVFVVDGFPRFHRSGCSELAGLHEEPVPHDQAVEDGFTACEVCRPEGDASAATATGAPAAGTTTPATTTSEDSRETVRLPLGGIGGLGVPADAVASASTPPEPAAAGQTPTAPHEVLVVDGYPCYHLPGCTELDGLDEEPVPYAQAVEDGFQACPVCRPESGGRVASDVRQVFVVDGYPDFHLEGCSQTAGLDAEQIPYDQAVEDGFAACEVCRPDEPHEAGRDSSPSSAVAMRDSWTQADDAAAAPAVEEPAVEEPASEHDVTAPVDAVVRAEPEASAAPEMHEELAAPTVPDAGVEPQAAGETSAAVEPQVTTDPEGPVEPDTDAAAEAEPATAEPEATAEPDVAAEPEAAAEPDVAAEPEATAESDVAAESEATADDRSSDEPEGAVGTTTVWVVDGRPRFHSEACLIIKGQNARPMAKDEAEHDGFRPCSLCQH